jgi:hypothetical protein
MTYVDGRTYKGAKTTTTNTGIRNANAVGVMPDCPTVFLHSLLSSNPSCVDTAGILVSLATLQWGLPRVGRDNNRGYGEPLVRETRQRRVNARRAGQVRLNSEKMQVCMWLQVGCWGCWEMGNTSFRAGFPYVRCTRAHISPFLYGDTTTRRCLRFPAYS